MVKVGRINISSFFLSLLYCVAYHFVSLCVLFACYGTDQVTSGLEPNG